MESDFNYGFTTDYQLKLHSSLPQPTYQYAFGYRSNSTLLFDWMGNYVHIILDTRDVHGNAWEMRDSYPSRGILMGMGTKLRKLMGMGREWE